MEMKATDKQVGGNHYKKNKIQPIEYIHANGLDFLSGNIIKYASRWRYKGGIQDLEKIKHYCDLLIQLEYGDKEIDKGDIFRCKDHVVMCNGEVAYIKGKTYVSDRDGCITDEQNNDDHIWTGTLDWRIFFEKIHKSEF